jgi:pSer/pThr/pTyr-binding forkhead associated (FHA) protein
MPQLQIFLSRDSPINFDIGEERVTIGRFAQNTLQINEPSVSGRHADVFLKAGKYHLRDAGSTNGTFVNEEQIIDAILQSGDEVRFGSVAGVFINEGEATLLQHRPDFLTTSFEPATSSTRPDNFVSSAPSRKNADTRDLLATALYGLAAIALLSFGATLFLILTM